MHASIDITPIPGCLQGHKFRYTRADGVWTWEEIELINVALRGTFLTLGDLDYFQIQAAGVGQFTGVQGKPDMICIFRFSNPRAKTQFDNILEKIFFEESKSSETTSETTIVNPTETLWKSKPAQPATPFATTNP